MSDEYPLSEDESKHIFTRILRTESYFKHLRAIYAELRSIITDILIPLAFTYDIKNDSSILLQDIKLIEEIITQEIKLINSNGNTWLAMLCQIDALFCTLSLKKFQRDNFVMLVYRAILNNRLNREISKSINNQDTQLVNVVESIKPDLAYHILQYYKPYLKHPVFNGFQYSKVFQVAVGKFIPQNTDDVICILLPLLMNLVNNVSYQGNSHYVGTILAIYKLMLTEQNNKFIFFSHESIAPSVLIKLTEQQSKQNIKENDKIAMLCKVISEIFENSRLANKKFNTFISKSKNSPDLYRAYYTIIEEIVYGRKNNKQISHLQRMNDLNLYLLNIDIILMLKKFKTIISLNNIKILNYFDFSEILSLYKSNATKICKAYSIIHKGQNSLTTAHRDNTYRLYFSLLNINVDLILSAIATLYDADINQIRKLAKAIAKDISLTILEFINVFKKIDEKLFIYDLVISYFSILDKATSKLENNQEYYNFLFSLRFHEGSSLLIEARSICVTHIREHLKCWVENKKDFMFNQNENESNKACEKFIFLRKKHAELMAIPSMRFKKINIEKFTKKKNNNFLIKSYSLFPISDTILANYKSFLELENHDHVKSTQEIMCRLCKSKFSSKQEHFLVLLLQIRYALIYTYDLRNSIRLFSVAYSIYNDIGLGGVYQNNLNSTKALLKSKILSICEKQDAKLFFLEVGNSFQENADERKYLKLLLNEILKEMKYENKYEKKNQTAKITLLENLMKHTGLFENKMHLKQKRDEDTNFDKSYKKRNIL